MFYQKHYLSELYFAKKNRGRKIIFCKKYYLSETSNCTENDMILGGEDYE